MAFSQSTITEVFPPQLRGGQPERDAPRLMSQPERRLSTPEPGFAAISGSAGSAGRAAEAASIREGEEPKPAMNGREMSDPP